LGILKRGILINKKKHLKNHQQRYVVSLTPLGKELAELIVDLEGYKNSYIALRNAIDKNFQIPKQKGGKALRSILRNNGWNEQELEWFSHYYEMIGLLLANADDILHKVLTKRYALMLREFGKISEIAKAIVNKIIIDGRIFQISFILRDIENDYSSPSMTERRADQVKAEYVDTYTFINQDVLDHFDESVAQDYYPKVILHEAKNMLLSFLFILKPPRELVLEYIQKLKSFRRRAADVDCNFAPSRSGREYDEGKRRRMKYELSRNENCTLSAY
jgi:hypothetical protein